MTADQPRVALVTCGRAGIGQAIASRLATDGYRVVVTSRTAVPGTVAPGIDMVPLDTTDSASVAVCVGAVIARAGRLDVLVNSMGNGMIGAVEEISERCGAGRR